MNLSPLPIQKFFDDNGRPLVGGLLYTYEAGTSTKTATYSDEAGTPNTNPIVLDYRGECDVWLDPEVTYKFVLAPAGDTDPPTRSIWTVDNIAAGITYAELTRQLIGRILWPRTAAEIAAGAAIVDYGWQEGWVPRYGTNTVPGTTDMTAAIQAALNVGKDVHFPWGTYAANNLVSSAAFQKLYAHGKVHIVKNANGDLFTSNGGWFEAYGIDFRGESATPAFTGHNIVLRGANPLLAFCAGQWAYARSVKATGNHVQITGTCGIYQTTDGTNYDIEIGDPDTVTLYHAVTNIYTSQPDGGIHLINTGGNSIIGSQFGKLYVEDGAAGVGTNGGSYVGNRIIGDITIELSNSTFSANVVSNATITFAAGTSGHQFDESNIVGSGATIVDDSNESYVTDCRLYRELQPYAVTWTASGAAPSIGDGTLEAYVTKQGRRVEFQMHLTFGSTTDPGTGNWTFTLPYTPAVRFIGAAQMIEATVNTEGGIAVFSAAGTFQVFPTEAPSNAIGSTVPFVWGNGDQLIVSGSYYVN